MIADIDVDDLPGILRDLVDLIGVTETMSIVEHYGGVRLYVPAKFDPEHPLIGVVGHKAAAALVEYAKGDSFDIPKADAALRAVRNRRIREQYQQSCKTQRDLALEYRLTDRQIRTILSGLEEFDDGQQSLF